MTFQKVIMNKTKRKRGNYLVEASMVLPIFIISVIMLISIIPTISQIENIIFSAVDEQRLENVKSVYRSNRMALPVATTFRGNQENKRVKNMFSYNLKYKFSKGDYDNLIEQRLEATFKENTPIGVFNKIVFSGKILSRSFSGTTRELNSADRTSFEEERDSSLVYIFPDQGERYHNGGCRILKNNSHLELLSRDIRKQYKPCKLCGSKDVELGSPVYCFEHDGYAYHKGNCKSIEKYYVEIEKSIAEKRGYTPCEICGG